MPAERAGYTVTMFLVDISPSMGAIRVVDLPPGPKGEQRTAEMTNLEWSLQFVKLKIQEMIFNGRKTDQCGVILFGSEDTDNVINEKSGGYEHVSEYIPVAQPNAGTLGKLDALTPSEVTGDPVDALIVGIETQDQYLSSKRTWTRKIVLLTDGENPIEIEDWEATVQKMDSLSIALTVIGVNFDDEELPFEEENKSTIKAENELFYKKLTTALQSGVMGTCALALQEISRPEIKQVKSTLMGTVIRLGDVDGRPDEAIEVLVKASKCTALTRPKGWKKFAPRHTGDEEYEGGEDNEERKVLFAQLKMRTEYYIDHGEPDDEDDESEDGNKSTTGKDDNSEKVEKEQLIRGFKYGTTYAPCPDGQFPRLPTTKGMDICGFFQARNFRRDLAMGEVQYIWADPSSAQQQVALSSIVQAMYEKDVLAIARWVTKDGMDPKMGVLAPSVFDKIDCLLWVQMPFADDVRKYNFASLDYLMSKKGERIMKHPYIPTDDQLATMEKFVDAMDLMDAGDKDEEGNRYPWFDTRLSYNPAVHRTKQALFHSAVVNDIVTDPIPPPHPELLKYFEPPKRVLKRARDAIEECKQTFKVKEVPKKVARARKDGHVRARDEDEDMILLDIKMPKRRASQAASQILNSVPGEASPSKPTKPPPDSDTETEDEDEEELLLDKKPEYKGHALPTPSRSLSPPIDLGRAPGRIIGVTYPLQDFKKNIAQGDLVSKAVEDMGVVIKDIVMKPFSSRRHDELLDCLKTLREVSLKEDEIDAWNEFLQDLKKSCISYPGNQEFWAQVQKLGREISLISTSEANKLGGISTVSDTAATEFIQ